MIAAWRRCVLRAYIVIVALAVLAVYACIYAANTEERTGAGPNVPSIARAMMLATSGRNNVALTTKTIVQTAKSFFMKAVSLTWRIRMGPITKPITASDAATPEIPSQANASLRHKRLPNRL
jgi:hypothetical protein